MRKSGFFHRIIGSADAALATPGGVLFALLWCACLVFYPQWYIQGTTADRLIPLALIYLAIVAGVAVVVWLFRGVQEPLLKKPISLYRAVRELWPILALGLLAHLTFLFGPVVTGLDAQEHAGVPAVLVALVRDRLPIPLPLVAWLALLLAAVGFRKTARKSFGIPSLLLIVAVLLLGGAALAVFLLKTNIIERIGDPKFISRYPALGRFLYIGTYALLGIHEWGGRMSQLILSALAAVYIYRTGCLFISKAAGIAGAAILLFLPPMFHYGNLNMLDCGTVALAVMSEFYLLRYLEESERRDFYLALFLLTAGVLYKKVLILLLPAAFVQWTLGRVFLSPQTDRRLLRAIPDAIGFLLPAGTAAISAWFSSFNPEVPLHTGGYRVPPLLHFFDPVYFLAPLESLSTALTWPILLLTPLGILIGFMRDRKARRFVCYGALWYAVYVLCYVPWETPWNIRQALPSYPPLLLFAAATFGWLLSDASRFARRILWGSLLAYLLWVALLFPRPEPAPDHRPIKDHTWMTLTNRTAFYLPYPEMFRRMRDHLVPKGAVVYAPMANEPSQFYLAAYGLRTHWNYLGDPWAPPTDQSIENLEEYCRVKRVSFLILPSHRWAQMTLSHQVLEAVANGEAGWLQPIEDVVRGTEHLVLYRVSG